MLYLLSKILPMPMRTSYCVGDENGPRQRSTWVQWRGRAFRHRITRLA